MEPDNKAKFSTGDKVVDKQNVQGNEMRVLNPNTGKADDVTIDGSGKTVSDCEGNEKYLDTDRVVTVVFTADIPQLPDSYQGLPLDAQLDKYTAEWGVKIRTYNYPESRLSPVSSSSKRGEDKQAPNLE
jgi:hypothetical protein